MGQFFLLVVVESEVKYILQNIFPIYILVFGEAVNISLARLKMTNK